MDDDNEDRTKNKFLFCMYVNHHQADINQLQKETEFLLDVTKGKALINNIDFKVVVHTLGMKEEESTHSKPISTISDVLFPDNNLLSVVHPTLHAKVHSGENLDTKNVQDRNSIKKFEQCKKDNKKIFNWLQQFENVALKTTDDLKNLGSKLQIDHKQFLTKGNFFGSYTAFKKLFQEKFKVFFSLLDGNHRATVLTKLLDKEPISDNYLRSENDKCIEVDIKAKVFDFFTVDIEYHPKELIDSRYARKQSYQIKSSGNKFFGSKFLDYFSSFSKYINNGESAFKECDDINFFGSKYGPNVTDAFMTNVTEALSEMVFIAIECSEVNIKSDVVLAVMKEKYIFKEFYTLPNEKRRKLSIGGDIKLSEETVLLMELMRLFCGKKSLLPKFTSFLRNPYQLQILKNESEYHFDREKTYVIKKLVTIIQRMSKCMLNSFVEELAIAHNKKPSEVKKFFMIQRFETMIQISILEDIVDVWNLIGYDPRVYINSVVQYGSKTLIEKVYKILHEIPKDDEMPFLLLLLEEYENNHRSYLNFIKHTMSLPVFGGLWMKQMLEVFKSDKSQRAADPSGVLSCKALKMKDQIYRENETTSILIPCSFKTFMELYFPCLFTQNKLDFMKTFPFLLFPKANFLEDRTVRDNYKKHRAWNIDDYVKRKFRGLNMEEDAPVERLQKKIARINKINDGETNDREIEEDMDDDEPSLKFTKKRKNKSASSEKTKSTTSNTTNKEKRNETNDVPPNQPEVEAKQPGEARRLANQLLNPDIYSKLDTEFRSLVQNANSSIESENSSEPNSKKSKKDSEKANSSTSSSSKSSSEPPPTPPAETKKQTVHKEVQVKKSCELSEMTSDSTKKTLLIIGTKLHPINIEVEKLQGIDNISTKTQALFQELQDLDLGDANSMKGRIKEISENISENLTIQKEIAMACKQSLDEERKLTPEDMDLLLQDMDSEDLDKVEEMVLKKKKDMGNH